MIPATPLHVMYFATRLNALVIVSNFAIGITPYWMSIVYTISIQRIMDASETEATRYWLPGSSFISATR